MKLMIRTALIVMLGSMLSACFSFSDKTFEPVHAALERQMPELSLKKTMALSLGSTIFNLIDLVSFNDDFDFSKIDAVQIAVYEVVRSADMTDLNLEQSMRAIDDSLQWDTMVKVNEAEENVRILVGMNPRKNSLEAMTIIVLERDELVMVKIEGKLEKVIEFAMQPASGRRGVPSFI
ncbi:MAG: hypothetical protein COC19_03480 [SAR86 cluster bacterium]|uniref:DUF4252 domain-containing protein n=1 Tax=SAR86 cluster bacterium TaxID=2030880 RepID=A0A2A4MQ94_9GAMM|nr:MAG: hypothetical protein COC19_03480 [SAR86 cluster bacterium]